MKNSLVRMIASSKRELTKDQPLDDLQKISRLQKVYKGFEGDWISPPWLVCPDVYVIPATMPVPEMLEAIEKHGSPCGIVGGALFSEATATKFHVLKIHFMSKGECRAAVDASEQATWKKYTEATRQMRQLLKGGGDA
jgi:hypothetical protein